MNTLLVYYLILDSERLGLVCLFGCPILTVLVGEYKVTVRRLFAGCSRSKYLYTILRRTSKENVSHPKFLRGKSCNAGVFEKTPALQLFPLRMSIGSEVYFVF